jgi:hypothetical protein
MLPQSRWWPLILKSFRRLRSATYTMTLSFRIQSRFKFNAACRPLLGHDSAMEASFSLGALFQFSGSFLVTAMNSSHPSATGTNAILG